MNSKEGNRNRTRSKARTTEEFFIDGNTVRRLEAAPDYRQIERERKEKEREAELRRKKRVARRNQEQALRMSRGYVIFLTVAVILSGVFAGTYIKLQSDVTTRLKNIANLETQIADLKADNDAAEKRINTATDLDSIKDVAMNQLGMTYANADQIIYYSVDNSDYMNQYSDIPNN